MIICWHFYFLFLLWGKVCYARFSLPFELIYILLGHTTKDNYSSFYLLWILIQLEGKFELFLLFGIFWNYCFINLFYYSTRSWYLLNIFLISGMFPTREENIDRKKEDNTYRKRIKKHFPTFLVSLEGRKEEEFFVCQFSYGEGKRRNLIFKTLFVRKEHNLKIDLKRTNNFNFLRFNLSFIACECEFLARIRQKHWRGKLEKDFPSLSLPSSFLSKETEWKIHCRNIFVALFLFVFCVPCLKGNTPLVIVLEEAVYWS